MANDQLNRKLKDALEDNRNKDNYNEELEKKLGELKIEYDSLKGLLKTKDQEIERLKGLLASRDEEIEQLKEFLEEQKGINARLESDNFNLICEDQKKTKRNRTSQKGTRILKR